MNMKSVVGFCLMASTLLFAGCGGGGDGGGGGVVTTQDQGSVVVATQSDGATTTGTTLNLTNATATIPQGTVLTDVEGNPVTGTVTATVSYSTSTADLEPGARALPTNAKPLSFVHIDLKNQDGATVKYLTKDIMVKVKVTGAKSGDTLVHYRFNGESWVAEGTVTVNADYTADVKVLRSSWHGLFHPSKQDTTPPTVLYVHPRDGAAKIAGNIRILAVFSEQMDPATITADTFTLKATTSSVVGGTVSMKPVISEPVAGTVYYDPDTRSALFRPSAVLTPESTFIATITTGVKDIAGNSMAADKTWAFSKEWDLDYVSPTVTATTPGYNATFVAANSEIVISFSEQMDPTTMNECLLSSTPYVYGYLHYDPVTNTAKFKPKKPLALNTVYTFTVREKAKDLAGNPLIPWTWSFATTSPTGTTGSSGMSGNF